MNAAFQEFGRGVCMTVAAYNPLFLNRDNVDQAAVDKERAFVVEQTMTTMAGKPQSVIDKAVEGRMDKYFSEKCLVEKPYVLDDSKSVEQTRAELVGKIGENIQIRRFLRWELGG